MNTQRDWIKGTLETRIDGLKRLDKNKQRPTISQRLCHRKQRPRRIRKRITSLPRFIASFPRDVCSLDFVIKSAHISISTTSLVTQDFIGSLFPSKYTEEDHDFLVDCTVYSFGKKAYARQVRHTLFVDDKDVVEFCCRLWSTVTLRPLTSLPGFSSSWFNCSCE